MIVRVADFDDLEKARAVAVGPRGGRYYVDSERRDSRGHKVRQYVRPGDEDRQEYGRWSPEVRRPGERDNRLPGAGTKMSRVYQGQQVDAVENADGTFTIMIDGETAGHGRTLTGALSSALGRAVNGFGFYRLGGAWETPGRRDWARVRESLDALVAKTANKVPRTAKVLGEIARDGVRAYVWFPNGERWVFEADDAGSEGDRWKRSGEGGRERWQRVPRKGEAEAVPAAKAPDKVPEETKAPEVPAAEPVPPATGIPPASLSFDAGLQKWIDALPSRAADALPGLRAKMQGWAAQDENPAVAARAARAVEAVDAEIARRAGSPEPAPDPAVPAVSPETAPAAVEPTPQSPKAQEPRPGRVRTREPKPTTAPATETKPGEARQRLTAEGYGNVGEKIGGSRKDLAALKAAYDEDPDKPVSTDDLERLESEAPDLARVLMNRRRQFGHKVRIVSAMRALGVDAGAAWWGVHLVSSVDEKPKDTPEARRLYAQGCHRLQEAIATWRTWEDALDGINAMRDEATGAYYTPEDHEQIRALRRVDQASLHEYNRLQRESIMLRQGAAAAKTPEESKRLSKEAGDKHNEAMRALEPGRAATSKIHEIEHRAKVRGQEAIARGEAHPMALLEALGEGFLNGIGVIDPTKKYTYKERDLARKRWNSWVKKSHNIYVQSDWSWADPKERGPRTPKNTEDGDSGEGQRDGMGKGFFTGYRRVVPDVVERSGGRRIAFKADTFRKEFGFRGIEYGDWMDTESTLHHTQRAGEALVDFADTLGIPASQVALNGRLALAFGARGAGKASAHYESGRKVINLTKTRGGGSLAHEWGHALDNITAMTAHDGTSHHTSFVTEDLGWGGSAPEALPAGVREAWQKVHAAIYSGDVPHTVYRVADHAKGSKYARWGWADNLLSRHGGDFDKALAEAGQRPADWHWKPAKNMRELAQYYATKAGRALEYSYVEHTRGTSSQYVADAQTLGKYWQEPVELFARAFESYIEDEMEEQGRRNTYLVTGTHHKRAPELDLTRHPKTGKPLHVYPRGEERARINAAMRELIKALRETGTIEKALRLLDRSLGQRVRLDLGSIA